MRLLSALIIGLMAASPAIADGFDKIDDRDTFVEVIKDKKLKRFGIDLTVSPGGEIAGRAFGRSVTGAWQWKSGYFCRDLYWGKRDLGPNCQAVKIQGETIRFISDQGTGQYADLVLK
ncbi:MAG: dihydrodipicolinate reductase [Pseudomonadota bacterium]